MSQRLNFVGGSSELYVVTKAGEWMGCQERTCEERRGRLKCSPEELYHLKESQERKRKSVTRKIRGNPEEILVFAEGREQLVKKIVDLQQTILKSQI